MNDRRLAAIMFTDIVGYTSLMAADEQNALKMLEAQRDLLEPSIKFHNGQWLKEMGDGTLSSFSSAADAVQAAIDIQKQCRESTSFKLRIGIHLGDVVFTETDVFGDGVNIAARIESIAEPGGIAVSGSVFDTLGSNKKFQTSFLGEKGLKGVNRPVRVYGVSNDGLPLPAQNDARFAVRENLGSAGNSRLLWPVAVLSLVLFMSLLLLRFAPLSTSESNQASSTATTRLPVTTSAASSTAPESELLRIAVPSAIDADLDSTGENGDTTPDVKIDLSAEKYIPPVIDSEAALISPSAPDIEIAENASLVESVNSNSGEEGGAHPVPVLESSSAQRSDESRSVLE